MKKRFEENEIPDLEHHFKKYTNREPMKVVNDIITWCEGEGIKFPEDSEKHKKLLRTLIIYK